MSAINQPDLQTETRSNPLRNWQKSFSGWLVLTIGVSLLTFVIVHQLELLNISQTKIYSDWMQGFCAVAATFLGWRVTRHKNLDKQTKNTFQLLTGAYFAFACGAFYWIVFNCILGHQPYISLGESFADVGFLAMYPLMISALFKFPTYKNEKLGTKFGLDVAIVAFGVMTVLWHFVVYPSLDKIDDGQWFSAIFKLLYPFGDCCLLVGSFKLLRNRAKGASQPALFVFSAGIAVLAAGDIGFNYLSLQKDYQPGHLIEGTWFLALFLFCLSSYYQYESASIKKKTKEAKVELKENWFDSELVTYSSVLIVSFILLIEASPYWATKIGFTVFAAFGLTGLIIARQIFALKENSRLFALQYKQNSELRFMSLIQNSSDLIFVFDGRGLIKYQSPSITRILGYKEGEMLNKLSIQYIHPEDVKGMTEDFMSFFQNPHKSVSRECRVLKTDGSWIILEGIVKLFVDEETGKPGIVLNARDVTERKEAEKKIAEFNLKLQQSNRELNDFAHIASHDLQEPLRKIQAFGSRLRTKDEANLSDNGKDYLERMENAANRMQTLIIDLLGFSRLTRQVQHFSQTDLNQIAEEVLSDLEVKIEETKAEIVIKNLPVIDAEPTQMRQLFQNLIGNALKFQQPNHHPKIEISACKISTDDVLQTDMCRIIVKDNGIGFEEKSIEKIFAVFQRLHGRSEYEGSGVGLAVCRKIAEHHNGQITAKSSLGNGAEFIVTIPFTQPKPDQFI